MIVDGNSEARLARYIASLRAQLAAMPAGGRERPDVRRKRMGLAVRLRRAEVLLNDLHQGKLALEGK